MTYDKPIKELMSLLLFLSFGEGFDNRGVINRGPLRSSVMKMFGNFILWKILYKNLDLKGGVPGEPPSPTQGISY